MGQVAILAVTGVVSYCCLRTFFTGLPRATILGNLVSCVRGSRKLKGKEKEDRSGHLLLCGGNSHKKAGAPLEEPRSAKRVSLLPGRQLWGH
jgi:hypothetical protein